MAQISQLGTQISHQVAHPSILITSRSFSSQVNGIGEYVYNRCLQDPDQVIVLAAGHTDDQKSDRTQMFPVYRWPALIGGRGIFVFNQLLSFYNIGCQLLLAIRLYFRYHYRYIEWCHGYDFPALLLLSYLLPIRFFIYLHGDDLRSVANNPLWRSLFKLTLKRAAGVICNSSYLRTAFRSRFRLDIPIHVISHLDDLRRRIRQLYNISETAVVILSVGRLIPQQGFELVIDNIPLLLTIGVDVHYIICGVGAIQTKLSTLAQRLRVNQRVHFAGSVSERELAGYYAACDIFAMLTLYQQNNYQSMNNSGLVDLEAGYFGKPVITSRLGMALDIVHHEENGLLVNPDSGLEVMLAFKRLSLDPHLREKLGRQGKELANRKNYHRWLYS
jgi:glycosyltransferase involved in cell wall biosynthesis